MFLENKIEKKEKKKKKRPQPLETRPKLPLSPLAASAPKTSSDNRAPLPSPLARPSSLSRPNTRASFSLRLTIGPRPVSLTGSTGPQASGRLLLLPLAVSKLDTAEPNPRNTARDFLAFFRES